MQLNAPRLRSPCAGSNEPDEGGNQHATERTAASLPVRKEQVDEK